MNNLKRMSIVFMIITMFAILFSSNVFAAGCSGIKSEAEEYYAQYGVTLVIAETGEKYTDNAVEAAKITKHKYAITYVTKSGDVCNLYTDSIPDDFGLWNTDIVVNEGRVVVTGVDGDDQSAWNLIYTKYRMFIMGVAGLGAITCVLGFILTFMKMGATAHSPAERSKSITMLLFTGAGAAGLGGVLVIFGFFWNLV